MSQLVLGCCGWAYNDWRGPFYPVDTASADYLGLYAQAFSSVEVDSTFYGPPSEATVRVWNERTPDQFRFALKVPQVITHEKKLRDAEGDFEEFVATTSVLGKKRGPLLLQFPRFSTDDFESAAEFLGVLDAFLSKVDRAIRLAVEIRNQRWFSEAFLDLLRDHAVAAALTDQIGGGPPKGGVAQVVTSDFTYIRLLGNRRRIEALTKTWESTVMDKTPELRTWAEFLVQMMEGMPEVGVWVFANNHFSGHAPAVARRLAAILDARP